MKKLLLMLVAFTATMTAFADDEGWQKSFTPVANKADLAGMHTAVAADGSVYASSTYDQAFQFAGKTVTDPEGLLSSIVLKYDVEGNEKWAVSLVGGCNVHAMVADTDGTLYVAGTVTGDKVTITDTDNHGKEIVNPVVDDPLWGPSIAANAGFVAKFTPEGVMTGLYTFNPQTNPEVAAREDLAYLSLSTIAFRPYKLVIDGDKVFVAARFMGDVPELGWKGAYVGNVEWYSTLDVYSFGVFSLTKNLSEAASVAIVQQTGVITDSEYDVEALDFVVYGGAPHVAFIGMGNLTLTTNAGSQPFTFEMSGTGNNEHAMVLANVNTPTQSKIFHAAPNDKMYPVFGLVGATTADGNCIMSGTFTGNFAFDNSKHSFELGEDPDTHQMTYSSSSFVASIKMADCSVAWSWVNDAETEATCMVVTGEEIHAATTTAMHTLKTANGELKETMPQGFEDAAAYNDQYVSTIFTDGSGKVYVFCPKMSTGIAVTKAAANDGNAKFYNLNGMVLTGAQKGLNIVKTAEGTKKVVK